MADYDVSFKIAARSSGPGLSRLAGIVPDEWEPIGDTLQTAERLADRAFRTICGGQRQVVYMEAYTRWVESAPWSVLSKSGLLSERERLPTRSLIFVLLPQGYRDQQGTFRLEAAPGTPTQQVWFTEVCLWKEKPEPWWEQHPGLMALYPLCDHGQETAQAVVRAAETIRHREMDSVPRGAARDARYLCHAPRPRAGRCISCREGSNARVGVHSGIRPGRRTDPCP
jgi:hypothetical protein